MLSTTKCCRFIKTALCSVSVAAILAGAPAYAGQQDIVAARTLAVTGYAEAKLPPDQAQLNLNVYTEHKQLAAGKLEQDKKMNQMMQILADNGIAKEKIRTQYAAINPIYDYIQNSKPRFRAYELTNRVEITIDDLSSTGPIVDKLVEAGFDRVENVQFQLKDQIKRREELLSAAVANAKGKAARMATELGVKLGKPVSVTESGAFNPPPVMMAKGMARAAMMADGAVAESSMPSYTPSGLVEINQTVNATFEVE